MRDFPITLTNGELALIDRALRMYAQHFQVQMGAEKDPTNKADLRARIGATDDVLVKLRRARGLPG